MKAVSYSGLQLYNQCPSAFNRRYILKEEVEAREKSKAVNRGLRIHQAIEDFLGSSCNIGLPDELEFYEGWLRQLATNETLKPEYRFCITPAWELTNFNSPEGMLRGVVDAILQDGDLGFVYEWKTGKEYPDHEMQRSLYGLAGLLTFPMVKEVTVCTVYLDSHKTEVSTFEREMLTAYQWLWEMKAKTAWAEQPYIEKPSYKCKWCDYAVDNGGKCYAGARESN